MLESFSNLHQRIISGVVMAVVALGATLAGGIGFRLLAVAIAAAMFWEWLSMTPGRRSGMALPGGLFLLAILPVLLGVAPLWRLAFAVVLGVVAALAAERNGEGAWTATGFAYAFLTVFCLAQLRGSGSAGLLAILFLFAVVWDTDIGAYFIGRNLGGARLAPCITLGKTWSGAIGGAACAGLAGMAMALAAGLSVP